ncbi:MAG TPA: PadR family transcriptional regulator [Pseudonocardiaceae bacterium]|nr:PadR family transcriptional regulator [Pseudonocardiaceae bacterium]
MVNVSGGYTNLTPTAWTILGFLSFCPRNGYQLRQAVQRSVGHFWGVSYGQLYPQLKNLSDTGLIEAVGDTDAPGRQQVWRLTEAGGAALRTWLAAPAEPAQRRDEGLVKLLFSDHAGVDVTRLLIAQRRDEVLTRRTRAEQTVPGAHWPPDAERNPEDLLAARLVRAHTIAVADAELAWCDAAEAIVDEHEEARHAF